MKINIKVIACWLVQFISSHQNLDYSQTNFDSAKSKLTVSLTGIMTNNTIKSPFIHYGLFKENLNYKLIKR